MGTINIHTVQPDLGFGDSLNFDMAVIVDGQKGGTLTVGARVLVQVRVETGCELRVLYALNGPDGVLTFVDRGIVERLVPNVGFRGVFAAVGTNMRFRVTNASPDTVTAVEFYSTIL